LFFFHAAIIPMTLPTLSLFQPGPLSVAEFITRWQKSTVSERAAAQPHFLDLCRLLGQPEPSSDPTGASYAFEKGVTKIGGGQGFADVWLRGHFAWEYKGKHKNLVEAYKQLLTYREDLENPPLLVVCDLNRFEVHTNFTDTVKAVYAFTLADLLADAPTPTCPLAPLEVLRALWEGPERLRPDRTTAQVTEAAAAQFSRLAESLRARGHGAQESAQFLIRLLFCLFAEDVGLLPGDLLSRLVERTRARPEVFARRLAVLFAAMSGGGDFGEHDIKHFNGGLFTGAEVLALTREDLAALWEASKLDWADIEPSIFGTLFERGLDPGKRAQLGAHYTGRADILLLVEPVLMAPLRRRWAEVQQEALTLSAGREGLTTAQSVALAAELTRLLQGFSEHLASVRVLDPACGSGNFLYVALRELLDLDKEVIAFAATLDLSTFPLSVGPEQMLGLELNEYAAQLAPVTVAIGHIQWLRNNAFGQPGEPILKSAKTIRHQDAVLAFDADGRPVEPPWPEADVVIGNPPFLGDKRMRADLGDGYVEGLRRLYVGKVPGGADLVTYWFERARELIAAGRVKRAGLLSTNSIRSGSNRVVLDHIKETGDIFMAWADRPWVLNGADVRVSMVGFDGGVETARLLDGVPAEAINADLTGQADVTRAAVLSENASLVFLGMMKGGPFDLDSKTAGKMLAAPVNVNGRPNSDVVRPRLGGQDVTGRPRGGYVIDFGVDMTEAEAAFYELPFEYVITHVKPLRDANRRESMKRRWWIHGEPRRALRAALVGKSRCIVTPEVAKYRLFVWMDTKTVPDHKLHVFARDDDYFFGVLHSKVHELWSLAQCSWMGVGNDPSYSSSRTFGTFPMPWPPGAEPTHAPQVKAIAEAARLLVEKRDAWLNPVDAAPADLAKRTLTNLYNARPAWLDGLHTALDAAVLATYGWPAGLADAELLERLLALNRARSGVQPVDNTIVNG